MIHALHIEQHRHRRLLLQIVIVTLLVALVLLFRLWRLSEVPIDFYFDEGAHGYDALRVLDGEHSPFFTTNKGREGLIVYTTAALTPFLGPSVLAVRLPVALASAGMVLALFWLGQILFNGQPDRSGTAALPAVWKGLFIAAVGAGLLAVSLGPTILGRTGYRANFLPFLLVLAVGTLWSGLQQRSKGRLLLAGIFTGLLPYTYMAARIVPLLLLMMGASFLWPLQRKRWEQVRQYIPHLLLYIGVSALVAFPILFYFAANPGHLLMRVDEVTIISEGRGLLEGATTLLRNIVLHLGAFGFVGDPRLLANLDQRPVLSAVEALFFWIGLGTALFYRRLPAYRLLLLWFGVLLLPALLSSDPEALPPNTLRMLGAMPAVFLVVGVGLWHAADLLANFLWQWVNRYALISLALIGFAVGMVISRGVNTYHSYFGQWVDTMYVEYYPGWRDLVTQVNQEDSGSSVVYLIPFSNRYPSDFNQYNFDFLYQRNVPAHLFRTLDENFPAALRNELAESGIPSSSMQIKAVQWMRTWTADATYRIPYLLQKYAKLDRIDYYADYEVKIFREPLLDRSWELYDWLDEFEIHFDGNLALQAAALGRYGGTQLSLAEDLLQVDHRGIWIVFHWRGNGSPLADYRISLRLHDQEGLQVYQQDWGIWNWLHEPTSHWKPGEQSESLHVLSPPVGLPEGEYELRLIVYERDSLIPTVEVGSWAAEHLLARLLIQNATD